MFDILNRFVKIPTLKGRLYYLVYYVILQFSRILGVQTSRKVRELFPPYEIFLEPYLKLKREEVFVDVGAHFGLHTAHIALRGNSVYAFEPNPWAFAVLCERTNEFPNVRRFNRAVGDTSGTTNLFIFRNEMMASVHKPPITSSELVNVVEVQCMMLDEMVFTSKVGLIKIDTEGAEAEVLRGAKRLIEENHPRLIIEIHDRVNLLAVSEFLTARSYRTNLLRWHRPFAQYPCWIVAGKQ